MFPKLVTIFFTAVSFGQRYTIFPHLVRARPTKSKMSSVWHRNSNALLIAVALYRRGDATPVRGGPRLELVKYNPDQQATITFTDWLEASSRELNIADRLAKHGLGGSVEREVWLYDNEKKTPIAITNQSAWETCRKEYIEKIPTKTYQITCE